MVDNTSSNKKRNKVNIAVTNTTSVKTKKNIALIKIIK